MNDSDAARVERAIRYIEEHRCEQPDLAQVAALSRNDALIGKTREEMEDRGTWVYIGLGTAALGTGISSAGWVLYGQNELSQGITIPLAAGGLLLGMLGVLMVTESIQNPLEPHLAPTPRHRLTRAEMRHLVVEINKRLRLQICESVERASWEGGMGYRVGVRLARHHRGGRLPEAL